MSSTATIRGYVEDDLKDTGNAVWTDAELNRHIQRAVREYSHYSPLEVKTELENEGDGRAVDVSSLVPRIRIVAAEYPIDLYPPEYVPFSLWADVLTLDLAAAPALGVDVNVYWHKEHTLHATVDASSTFPTSHDDIIATGAAAYAALQIGAYVSNRVNVGGEHTWGRYQEFGETRLGEFHRMLEALPAKQTLRTSRLYTGDDVRLRSQSTDPGPV